MALKRVKVDWHYEITTELKNLTHRWIGSFRIWERYGEREIERFPSLSEGVEASLGDTEEKARQNMKDMLEAWIARKRKEQDEAEVKEKIAVE